MLSGGPIKYGLITKKPTTTKKVPLNNIFGGNEDDEKDETCNTSEDVGNRNKRTALDLEKARVNKALATKQSSTTMLSSIPLEDPSIYDYDNAYDSFKRKPESLSGDMRSGSSDNSARDKVLYAMPVSLTTLCS
jgi:hypothetical protein